MTLYTTYIARISKIPAEIKKYLIIRHLPPNFNPDKHKNTVWLPDFAPSAKLLRDYHHGIIMWDEFKDKLCQQFDNDHRVITIFQEILKEVKEGKKVAYVCYEKDHTKCHRSLAAQWTCDFSDNTIQWEELI